MPLWPSSFNLVGLCWFGQSSEFLALSGLFCEHTRSCLPLSLKTLTLGTLIHCARSPATSVEGWEWRRAVPLSSGTCHFHQAIRAQYSFTHCSPPRPADGSSSVFPQCFHLPPSPLLQFSPQHQNSLLPTGFPESTFKSPLESSPCSWMKTKILIRICNVF